MSRNKDFERYQPSEDHDELLDEFRTHGKQWST